MKHIVWAALGALSLAGLLSSTAMAADVKSIAILTPEEGTDFGWNQQGIDAAKAAGAKEGVKVVVAQNLGYGDVRPDHARTRRGRREPADRPCQRLQHRGTRDRRRGQGARRDRRHAGQPANRAWSPTTR